MQDIITTRVGRFDILTLTDGFGRAPNALFPDYDADRAHAAAAQSGEAYDGETVSVPIQGFVIRDGDDITLVDAGAPDGYSPTTGAFMDNLAKAGIAPAQVTRLAMTHLHVDHVGQMVRPDGAKTFPNAQLIHGAGDWDHFFSDAVYDRTRPGGRERASLDVSRRACAPYADTRREIGVETEFAPGLTMVPLPGHTPGHSGIRIDDGGDSLLIWGDTIHSAAFQVAEPDWGVLFDVDPVQARATRRALFADLAASGLPILGPHVPQPGPWRVEKARIGYRLTPA
ncbi:MBL fold metallo-hydrolase [Pseudooceanicola onchidii]|uniref:MBL fold metallo-hydrolase n=1 Tax=Pseudooceanicola onchidii TaxID=2562279 RepID=UPI0010A9C191|nr:MBL fold metallo-hydrolase [Pseudooceanicola onchidii]